MGGRDSKKILIIEDEQELVTSLVTLFKSEGYQTLAAYDGTRGTSLAHQGKVDLIILDLALPAGNGFFVLENLKEVEATRNIPVVVLTCKIGEDLEEKARKMGVVAYIRKPFSPSELLEQVKEILDKR